MALQTSGQISLNDIHLELGGSSGSQVSMNDSDVRGLIDKSSGAAMSLSEWYGAASWDPTASHTVSHQVEYSQGSHTFTVSQTQMNNGATGLRIVAVGAGGGGGYFNANGGGTVLSAIYGPIVANQTLSISVGHGGNGGYGYQGGTNGGSTTVTGTIAGSTINIRGGGGGGNNSQSAVSSFGGVENVDGWDSPGNFAGFHSGYDPKAGQLSTSIYGQGGTGSNFGNSSTWGGAGGAATPPGIPGRGGGISGESTFGGDGNHGRVFVSYLTF